MTPVQQKTLFWAGASFLFLWALWGLQGVLLPFVLGLLVAYFLNPLVQKVEAWGAGRTLAASAVLLSFAAVFVFSLLLIFPVLQEQFARLVESFPVYADKARALVSPFVEKIQQRLLAGGQEDLKQAAGDYAADVFQWLGGLLGKVWNGGLAVVDILSVVLVAPVVSFYFLRDWDTMIKKVDGWLPRQQASVIRKLAKEMDAAVSGFIRGQALVCLSLGFIYGLCLTLAGLNFGFLIGLMAGILSFIPYVGSIIGFVAALVVGYFQYDGEMARLVVVAVIFGIGQFFEGNVLTPRLVGEKVGLHAVWVIFALMAGGSLLGFTGVMIAVPVAAVIGVLVRFGLKEYLSSRYYTGKAS